jgi:hypothetical protein
MRRLSHFTDLTIQQTQHLVLKPKETTMKSMIKTIKSTAFLVGALALTPVSPAWADQFIDNRGILPPQTNPYGESYGQWAADWWTWAQSIPSEINPLNDTNGADAGVGQHGPVWFLAGATGSGNISATRNIAVPEGKALFFPILNTLWTTGPTDPPITVPEIKSILAGVTADATNLSCTIDGLTVKHLEKYVTVSPMFSLTVPTDNVLGLAAAVYTPDVDEGFYLMLAPLCPGHHTIHFSSNNVDLGIALDITYHITVGK